MLLTIHNLPSNVRYGELKSLIEQKCGLTEVILDNLVSEGALKKVTVGLADEGDGAILVRKMNGLYWNGQQLYVENVRQTEPLEQPYRANPNLGQGSKQQNYTNTNEYQPSNQQKESTEGFAGSTFNQEAMYNAMPGNYGMPMGGMFYNNMAVVTGVSQYQNKTSFDDRPLLLAPQPLMSTFVEPFDQQNQAFGYGGTVATPNIQENTSQNWQQDSYKSYGDRQVQSSPSRGQKPPENINKHVSRWENKQDTRGSRRNDRSPPRDVRNTFQPNTSFENNRDQRPYRSDTSDYSQKRHSDMGPRPTFSGKKFDDANDVRSANRFSFNSSGNQAPEPTRGSVKVWNTNPNYGEQWNEPSSLQRNEGKPRWEGPRNDRPRLREDPKQFQPRNADRSGPRPTKPVEFRGQGNKYFDEPQAKRFAHQSNPRNDSFRDTVDRPAAGYRSQFTGVKPQINDSQGSKTRWSDKPQFSRPVKNTSSHSETMKMLHKSKTWRGQATSIIAKEMLNNLEIPDYRKRDMIMQRLKKGIKTRIELLMGDKLFAPAEEIVLLYEQKYPSSGDQEFFNQILEGIKGCQKKGDDQKAKEVSGDAAVDKPSDQTSAATTQAKVPPQPVFKEPVGKLPKYANADKKLNHQLKQIHKKEYEEELYELAPIMQKTLDEHCDTLCDLFMTVCENPDLPDEKSVCEQISDQVADDFRKVIRLNVTKRLLDIKSSLLVRVFCMGKPPKRDNMEAFLKNYGVISMKKSDKTKMFIVKVNSYKKFDELCGLGTTSIDGVTVQFKPMHITGPPSAPRGKEDYKNTIKKLSEGKLDMSLLQPPDQQEQSQDSKETLEESKNLEEIKNVENVEEIQNDEEIQNVDEDENVEETQNNEEIHDVEDKSYPEDYKHLPEVGQVTEEDLEDY